ncbi:MAG: response regulator transcription factor [Clostridia bacterium]|nr:response regulator transcription factor [Clostridia bacterium]
MTNNKFKILLVEDETNIQNFVAALLETSGYQVIRAESCMTAQTLYSSYLPDLVILDLGLPDKDGMVFLEYVRKNSLTPILVLSARSMERDKVAALDNGANDYVTKPFSAAELLARVRSLLRISRFTAHEDRGLDGRFSIDELLIDYDARQVFIKGEEIKLTQTEFNIVAFLAENAGKMMTYSAIIKAVWGGCAQEGSIKKLQVNMANIRKKFGATPGTVNYITNELGVGYRMNS